MLSTGFDSNCVGTGSVAELIKIIKSLNTSFITLKI